MTRNGIWIMGYPNRITPAHIFEFFLTKWIVRVNKRPLWTTDSWKHESSKHKKTVVQHNYNSCPSLLLSWQLRYDPEQSSQCKKRNGLFFINTCFFSNFFFFVFLFYHLYFADTSVLTFCFLCIEIILYSSILLV